MAQRTVRLYIYNASSVPCPARPSLNSMDRFEHKLPALFAAGSQPMLPHGVELTDDPMMADVLYHPACLVRSFFTLRAAHSRKQAEVEARALEATVLAQITATGREHMPHIIHALRCRGNAADVTGEITDARYFFPRLWWGGTFARFCVETFSRGVLLDTSTSFAMPYCPAAPAAGGSEEGAASTPPSAARRTRVLFIGSNFSSASRKPLLRQRGEALAALSRTPGHEAMLLHRREMRHNPSLVAEVQQRSARRMREATYTLCPPGDAPESSRIYQALAAGSIPLVGSAFVPAPLANEVNWSSVTHVIATDGDGRLVLPDAEREAALRRAVWRHRRSFECEPSSQLFVAYVARALRRVAAWGEQSWQEELARASMPALERSCLRCGRMAVGARCCESSAV